MSKHTYAYGHRLSFNPIEIERESDVIYINEVLHSSLTTFPFRIDFHTNQNRTVYLCAKHNFRDTTSLDEWMFVVEDVVTFVCDAKQQQIFYKKSLNYSDTLMNYWLIHIILPMYLSLNNKYYFFHAGAVEVADQAVLFVGDSYAGKSTLTDFFLKKEHLLLSDDKLGTFYEDGEIYCVSSHEYHRPYRCLEDLGIKAKFFNQSKVPLKKIFWLEPVGPDETINIKELKGLKKFEVLRYATEMDLYVNQKERFTYLSKLANQICIYKLQIPHNKDRLEEVYQKIIEYI